MSRVFTDESLYKWSRSHDQDCCHAHVYLKHSKLFTRTRSPMILKTWYGPLGTQDLQSYINDDPGLTLFYGSLGQIWLHLCRGNWYDVI